MIVSNITLGLHVSIDTSSSINNVIIGDYVKIAKYCSVYGAPENVLEIGAYSYVGMHSMINGYKHKLTIGKHVSIAQHVLIMVDSGPNASKPMQRIFPMRGGSIYIGDHCWIGAQSIIMPAVSLGKFSVVAANSFVKDSFPDYSIIGGNPARLIRTLNDSEIQQLQEND